MFVVEAVIPVSILQTAGVAKIDIELGIYLRGGAIEVHPS